MSATMTSGYVADTDTWDTEEPNGCHQCKGDSQLMVSGLDDAVHEAAVIRDIIRVEFPKHEPQTFLAV